MVLQLASKLWWRRHVARHACAWDELEEFPALPPDRQRAALAARLLQQIQYFGAREDALPEWREAARVRDAGELWRLWPSLPVMNKATLQSRFEPREMAARFGLQGRVDSTGGSTGEPTHFFHDTAMLRATEAALFRTRLRLGWKPGMPTIIVWGSERDIGKHVGLRNRTADTLFRNHLIDGYHINRGTVARVLDIMRREAPVAIYGFTSMLHFVAEETLAMKAAPRPGSVRAAWNGGEMLFPEQVSVFRSAFGVPILNRYGGRELSQMACQYKEGGPLHILRPWLFMEVLDDRGRPVGPGESGRLVWTSTVCRGTPFLRYDIEDLGVYDREHETEAGIAALRELQGRVASLLQLPDGRKINNIYWNHLFKEFAEVQQFQVTLTREGGLRLLLKGEGFAAGREERVRGTLRGFLGELPVSISWVDKIPLTAQGKLVQVVREK
jgi:phenylacetate-CoA ligase